MQGIPLPLDRLRLALKGRIVIFIDAANLEHSVRSMWVNPKDVPDNLKSLYHDQLQWRIDYKKFHSFFTEIYHVHQIRFYSAAFSSESHQKFLTVLKKSGYKLVTKPLKEYEDHTQDHPHRKANFDVEITVDAVYELNQYDTLILFSGDSDFAYLLRFLRGQNKVVIVFSRSGHVAKELPPASSYYFDIVDFRHVFLRAVPKAKSPA